MALALLATLVVPVSTRAQGLPGLAPNDPLLRLGQTLAGIDVIRAEIASLRRQLASCDTTPAAAGCASRALLRAKLNYLLDVSRMMGDPDTAGAPPKPEPRPTDPSDYTSELRYLQEQLKTDRSGNYLLSENRARFYLISNCQALRDLSRFRIAFMTPQEANEILDVGRSKMIAAVNACIRDYDVKEVVANRKAAAEYCVQATTDKVTGARTLFSPCMRRHDILMALCTQGLETHVAWSQHKYPDQQHAPGQLCPIDQILINLSETQTILAAPRVAPMPELPPRFFAPPDVVIPQRAPLPIPAGTTIEVRLPGTWDGFAVDNPANPVVSAIMDQPLVIAGKTVLGQYTSVNLKARILGPSQIGARPDRVQIGFTIDEVNSAPPGKWSDLPSNEAVFTVPYQATLSNPGLPLNARVRLTTGAIGSVEMPSAQPPAPGGQPKPAAPAPGTQAAPASPSPQQQGDDARARADRIQACMLQAMKNYPSGLAQAQAISACAQVK